MACHVTLPFLHFHNGPDRTYADVRFGGDFEPVTASTPKLAPGCLRLVTAGDGCKTRSAMKPLDVTRQRRLSKGSRTRLR
jgi:hypothetical protein